jgi:hypothetical protein
MERYKVIQPFYYNILPLSKTGFQQKTSFKAKQGGLLGLPLFSFFHQLPDLGLWFPATKLVGCFCLIAQAATVIA